MTDNEKILERVTDLIDEAAIRYDGHVTHGSSSAMRTVLTVYLLPLLDAGEEMRSYATNLQSTWKTAIGNWDAAKRKAVEQ